MTKGTLLTENLMEKQYASMKSETASTDDYELNDCCSDLKTQNVSLLLLLELNTQPNEAKYR